MTKKEVESLIESLGKEINQRQQSIAEEAKVFTLRQAALKAHKTRAVNRLAALKFAIQKQ